MLSPSFLYIRPATRAIVVRSCTVPLRSDQLVLQSPGSPSVSGYGLKTDLCQPFSQDRYSMFWRFPTSHRLTHFGISCRPTFMIGSNAFARRKTSITQASVRAHRPDYSEISPRNKFRHWVFQRLFKAQKEPALAYRVIFLLYKKMKKWQFPIYLVFLIFPIDFIAR